MNVIITAEELGKRRCRGAKRVEHQGRYRQILDWDSDSATLALDDATDPPVLPAPKVVCVAAGVRVVRRVAESREDEYVIERMQGTDAMGAPRWEQECPDAPYRAALIEMAKRLEEAGRGEA